MNQVMWDEELATGIGIIDDQHKKLIERINSFEVAVESQDMDEIESTVNYLMGYTIQHFGAEELIMIRNGYSDFKNHREEHTRFINMVYDTKKAMLEKRLNIEQINTLKEELANWTVNHIKIIDGNMAKEINKKS